MCRIQAVLTEAPEHYTNLVNVFEFSPDKAKECLGRLK